MPISEEESSNNNIYQVPLKELYTKDTALEVSRALQEDNKAFQSLQGGSKASQAPQELDEVSRALQSGGDSQSGGTSSDYNIILQPN